MSPHRATVDRPPCAVQALMAHSVQCRVHYQLLNKGVPPTWCAGLIHPIFKAGKPEDAGNYKGITVVVILAELYAMVTNDWKPELQGGLSIVSAGSEGKQAFERIIVRQIRCLSYRLW